LQVHFGKCLDPRDFNGGWEKVLVLEGARISDYGTDELGALEPSQRSAPGESTTFIGTDAYELKRLALSTRGDALVNHEILDVWFCDTKQCGECGTPSDGCQVIIGITAYTGSSAGLTAEIVYSQDGGKTWSSLNLGLGATESPSAGDCVGSQVVVVCGGDTCGYKVCDIVDLLAGVPEWDTITDGIIATKCPNAIFSLGPSLNWFAAEDGYIYFSSDLSGGVSIQESGSLTTQDLTAIHGIDLNNIITVGESNTVLLTRNGGTTWTAITGPAAGVALNTCWMKSADEWWIGTAGGKLYYTLDGGTSWTEKTFTGSGSGSVNDIAFVTSSVGYMIHNTGSAGRLFRTIDGGYSWYVLPEGTGSIPSNYQLNSIALCDDPNIVYAGGLETNSGDYDGILIVGA